MHIIDTVNFFLEVVKLHLCQLMCSYLVNEMIDLNVTISN